MDDTSLAPHPKRCSSCGMVRNRAAFHKDRKAPDGLRYQCKDCVRAYHDTMREALRERVRAWGAAHPEQVAKRGRRYRSKHPEMVSERHKIARATHPEYEQNPRRKAKKVSYQATRRAREVGVGGSHTQEEWEALCAAHGGACAWCGCTYKPLTRDHIVPLSRGGSHDITNIQPLCRNCNCKKGAR